MIYLFTHSNGGYNDVHVFFDVSTMTYTQYFYHDIIFTSDIFDEKSETVIHHHDYEINKFIPCELVINVVSVHDYFNESSDIIMKKLLHELYLF